MDDREIVQSIFNDATKDRFIMIIDIPSMLKDPRNPCKNIIKRNFYKLATTITGTVFPKIVVPQTNIQELRMILKYSPLMLLITGKIIL